MAKKDGDEPPSSGHRDPRVYGPLQETVIIKRVYLGGDDDQSPTQAEGSIPTEGEAQQTQ